MPGVSLCLLQLYVVNVLSRDVTGVTEMSGVEEIKSTTSEVQSTTSEDTEMPLEDIPPVYVYLKCK